MGAILQYSYLNCKMKSCHIFGSCEVNICITVGKQGYQQFYPLSAFLLHNLVDGALSLTISDVDINFS